MRETRSVIILFMDVAGFSKNKEWQLQKDVIETLNRVIDQLLQRHRISQLVGRLPTGDGLVLLVPTDWPKAHSKILEIAKRLRDNRAIWAAVNGKIRPPIALRIGINQGIVVQTVLGTTGVQNFCGHEINMGQRIMSFAHAKAPIACSKLFVTHAVKNGVPRDHFGVEFEADVKHGKKQRMQFYYGKQAPGSVEEKASVEDELAMYQWKCEKLNERGGVDFYTFAFERGGQDKECLHQQLVGKNFARVDDRTQIAKRIKNKRRFKRLHLGEYPVTLSDDGHEHTSISGPGLNLGDLLYGGYRVTFYFSIDGTLGTGKLVLETCYGPSMSHEGELSFRDRRGKAAIKKFTSRNDNYLRRVQNKDGWIEQELEFVYSGQAFVQFRFRLLDLGQDRPRVIFYKVHLEHRK